MNILSVYKKLGRDWTIISIIFLFSLFLRLWKIGSVPAGINGDIALLTENASLMYRPDFYGKFVPSFIPDHNFFWFFPLNILLLVVIFTIKGISHASLLSSGAIVDAFLIIPVYFLAKQIYQNKTVAVIASLLIAGSTWNITIVRSGFAHLIVPVLLGTSAIYFIKLAIEENYKSFIWAGLFLGLLILNGYPTFLIFFLVAAVAIFFNKKILKHLFNKYFLFGILTFIVVVVGGAILFAKVNQSTNSWIVFEAIKKNFFSGSYHENTIRYAQGWNRQSLAYNLSTIKENFNSTFRLLFVTGSNDMQFGIFRIFNRPLMNPVFSILFLTGLLFSLKNKKSVILYLWLMAVTILFIGFTIPRERFLLTASPAIAIFAAYGLVKLFEVRNKYLHSAKILPFLLIIGGIGYFYAYTFRPYFIEYAQADGNEHAGFANQIVADFIKKNYDPQKISLATTSQMPFFGILTNYKYNFSSWPDFWIFTDKHPLNLINESSIKYKDQQGSVSDVNFSKKALEGKTPSVIEIQWSKPVKLSYLVIDFDGYETVQHPKDYTIQYYDQEQQKWVLWQDIKNNKFIITGNMLGDIETSALKINFLNSHNKIGSFKVRDIMVFSSADDLKKISVERQQKIQKEKIVIVFAVHPNIVEYAGYGAKAYEYLYQYQAFFPDLKPVKTINNGYGGPGYYIYELP